MNKRKHISDVEKELQLVDMRCGSLKSQLNYMKMLYQRDHPGLELNRNPSKTSQRSGEIFSAKTCSTSPDEKVNDVSGLEELRRALQINTVSLRRSPRHNITRNTFLSENCTVPNDLEINELSSGKVMEAEFRGHTPRMYTVPKSTEATPRHRETIAGQESEERLSPSMVPDDFSHIAGYKAIPLKYLTAYHKKILLVSVSSTSSRKHYPVSSKYMGLQNKQAEYEQFFLHDNSAEFWEEPRQHILNLPLSGNERIKEKIPSPKKEDTQSLVANLNNSRSTETLTNRTHRKKEKKNTSASVTGNKKSLTSKTDEILTFKIRRKKGKLSTSNSKSTVATRDTSFGKKKDNRKRRLSTGMKSKRIAEGKQRANYNEVVEIFPNNSANIGSTSVLSGKRSKFSKNTDHGSSFSMFQNNYGHHPESREKYTGNKLEEQNVLHTKLVTTEKGGTKITQPIGITNQSPGSSRCHHAVVQTAYYDPSNFRNYEMPTMASNLKKVDRSYFSRFHFRNIPFVVGTSVTPSHNLGLNIQQVLSILKTRQPVIGGTTPLLIRKVSRGMEPISVLIDGINNRSNMNFKSIVNDSKSLTNSSPIIGIPNSSRFSEKSHSIINRSSAMTVSNNRQYRSFRDEFTTRSGKPIEVIPSETISKNFLQAHDPFGSNKDITTLKSFSSQQYIKSRAGFSNIYMKKPQMESIDNMLQPSSSTQQENNRGIREVLINLHDQFDALNSKYEKLQEEMEETGDEKLTNELSNIEAELNAKEDEINAVVGLYKEVMALKQEMKLMHEKNSLVCISTEISEKPKKSSYPGIPGFLRLDKCYPSKKNNYSTTYREPSAAIRLAALLRQIQIFQKQLKSEFS